MKKWTRDLNRHFPTKEKLMANTHPKICSISIESGKCKLKLEDVTSYPSRKQKY